MKKGILKSCYLER